MSGSRKGVVIGGSAGSLDALNKLLSALPVTPDASIFVVIHISPIGESLLPSVVGAYTQMPVREALDKLPIAAGSVVVAPPDYHLLVERDGTLALSRDGHEHFSRPAIDPLFVSAAQAYGRDCYGVLLSGGNADGAAGLVAIREAGGKVAVQDPATSTSPEMPRAALARLEPDCVGTGTDIGRWLAGELGGAR